MSKFHLADQAFQMTSALNPATVSLDQAIELIERLTHQKRSLQAENERLRHELAEAHLREDAWEKS